MKFYHRTRAVEKFDAFDKNLFRSNSDYSNCLYVATADACHYLWNDNALNNLSNNVLEVELDFETSKVFYTHTDSKDLDLSEYSGISHYCWSNGYDMIVDISDKYKGDSRDIEELIPYVMQVGVNNLDKVLITDWLDESEVPYKPCTCDVCNIHRFNPGMFDTLKCRVWG